MEPAQPAKGKLGYAFRDRREAGVLLGRALRRAGYGDGNGVVLALPRGGLVVGAQAAYLASLPFAPLAVRKVRAPYNPELAIGAVAEGEVELLAGEEAGAVALTPAELKRAQAQARTELAAVASRYRPPRPPPTVAGRPALIVDDGLATGFSAAAAAAAARRLGAAEVVVAAPVASRGALALLARFSDRLFLLQVPEPFFAVGRWYRDFRPPAEQELAALLSFRPAVGERTFESKPARGRLTLPPLFWERGVVVLGGAAAAVWPLAKRLGQNGIGAFALAAPRAGPALLGQAVRWLRCQPECALLRPVLWGLEEEGAGPYLAVAQAFGAGVRALILCGTRSPVAADRRLPLLVVGPDERERALRWLNDLRAEG